MEDYFTVEIAENGLKAVQTISNMQRDYFDAVILDINMPIMGGYEACSLIYAYLNDI